MRALNTFRFILEHPLSRGRRCSNFSRFVKWQIASRLLPGAAVFDFVNNSRLLARKGLTGATGNLYAGLHEFNDMAFVLHLLRPKDLFIDIGANVGAYTILAGAAVGAHCLSFEPIPRTFQWLLDNVNLNGISARAKTRNIGIGKQKGALRFTGDRDTVNHVVSDAENATTAITVPIETLDGALGDQEPLCIKMDVEGFESEVIAGGEATLGKAGLLGVIMELNGSGKRYGYDEAKLHAKMLEWGFRPYRYLPFERDLVSLDGKDLNSDNTLYLRDIESVNILILVLFDVTLVLHIALAMAKHPVDGFSDQPLGSAGLVNVGGVTGPGILGQLLDPWPADINGVAMNIAAKPEQVIVAIHSSGFESAPKQGAVCAF